MEGGGGLAIVCVWMVWIGGRGCVVCVWLEGGRHGGGLMCGALGDGCLVFLCVCVSGWAG